MDKKNLPTGIASFAMMRKRDCYYVDKTPLIRQLVEENNYVFLSRPRRFGKSLLVSTLAAL
ncbi:MAG: AAA family ATPase, partial [Gammaproteobacteria bacterium]|nr:AAA family ATPase [Gammaproteobacteria bacterium]